MAAWELLALVLEAGAGDSGPAGDRAGGGGQALLSQAAGCPIQPQPQPRAVACAVHDEEIGVDIERLRTPPKRLGRGMAPEDFFRLWTAREATVKRRGQGVAALLQGEAPDPRCRCLTGLLPPAG